MRAGETSAPVAPPDPSPPTPRKTAQSPPRRTGPSRGAPDSIPPVDEEGQAAYRLITGLNLASYALLLLFALFQQPIFLSGVVTLLIAFALATNRIETIGRHLKHDPRARVRFGLQMAFPCTICFLLVAGVALVALTKGELQGVGFSVIALAMFGPASVYSLGLVTGTGTVTVTVDDFVRVLKRLSGSGYQSS